MEGSEIRKSASSERTGGRHLTSLARDLMRLEIECREMVGVRGFEPPTTATPLRCATRLRYTPKMTKALRSDQDVTEITPFSVSGSGGSPRVPCAAA